MWSGKTEGKVYNFPNQLIFKTCQSAQKSRPLKHNVMLFSWCVGAAGLYLYGREKSK